MRKPVRLLLTVVSIPLTCTITAILKVPVSIFCLHPLQPALPDLAYSAWYGSSDIFLWNNKFQLVENTLRFNSKQSRPAGRFCVLISFFPTLYITHTAPPAPHPLRSSVVKEDKIRQEWTKHNVMFSVDSGKFAKLFIGSLRTKPIPWDIW